MRFALMPLRAVASFPDWRRFLEALQRDFSVDADRPEVLPQREVRT